MFFSITLEPSDQRIIWSLLEPVTCDPTNEKRALQLLASQNVITCFFAEQSLQYFTIFFEFGPLLPSHSSSTVRELFLL